MKNDDVLRSNSLFIFSYMLDKKQGMKKTKDELITEYRDISNLKNHIKKKVKTPTINEIFGDKVITSQEIIKKLGKKWLTDIEKISYIVKYYNKKKWKNAIHFYIPTTNTFFVENIGNQVYVSNILKKCQNIGLIKVKDDFYRFNAEYHEDNKSKTYYWNSRVAEVIEDIMRKNGIRRKICKKSRLVFLNERIENLKRSIDDKKMENLNKYRNKLYIKEHTNIDLDIDTALIGLYDNYKPYEKYYNMMKEYNVYENSDNVENFQFKLRKSKDNHIKGIAIRVTSEFCNIESENRKSILEDLFNGFCSNDSNGSIYRQTYLLNTGKWLDDNIDVYEYIFGSKLDEVMRFAVKNLCMLCYFSSSLKKAESSLCFEKGESNPVFKQLYEMNYNGIRDSFRWFYKNLKEKLGNTFWRSEIFFHESCSHIGAKKIMIDMGSKVYKVYDGFFTDKNFTKSEFNEIIRKSSLEYYHEYEDWIKERKNMIDNEHNEEIVEESEEEREQNRKDCETFDRMMKEKKEKNDLIYMKERIKKSYNEVFNNKSST